MKVVVSGATGFLGGHLCRHLKALGHDVLGLGRDVQKGAALEAEGIEFQQVDLSVIPSYSQREKDKGHIDAFVHCAALSSNWGPAQAFHAANVVGTQNALDMAGRIGARRFVHISSPSVAFRFRHQLNQRESDPLPAPVNSYAASKQQAETVVSRHPNAIILRPRGLYGKGDTALLPRLVRAARDGALPLLNHGDAVTDLTHIDDAVAAIVRALESDVCGTFNISGGEPVTIKSIIEQACAHAGIAPRFTALPVPLAMTAARLAELAARLTPGQPEPVFTAYSVGVMAFSQTLDLTLARRDLGFSPAVSFAEGLRRTFA